MHEPLSAPMLCLLPSWSFLSSSMSLTTTFSRWIDAFDQWCLRHILRIPYKAHVTNDEVRRRTCQPPATHHITTRRLRLFGHIARARPSQDHSRALRAAISRLPVDWHRPHGRPRRTWLRTIELDLQQHNLGLNSAWKRAQDRSKWRKLVETAMSFQGRATRWWWACLTFSRVKVNKLSYLITTKLLWYVACMDGKSHANQTPWAHTV